MIEHVDAIGGSAPGSGADESRFPAELTTTFNNLERNFTPWGFGHATRADWAEGLNVPLWQMSAKPISFSGLAVRVHMTPAIKRSPLAFTRLARRWPASTLPSLGTERKCTAIRPDGWETSTSRNRS